VVHRDLKPANLVIDDKMKLKIVDFGLANYIRDNRLRKTFCGTPYFIAPEIVEKKWGYGFQVDWWSVGVILYTLLYGKCPFTSDKVDEVY
jgi:serine/threonine protein kinase